MTFRSFAQIMAIGVFLWGKFNRKETKKKIIDFLVTDRNRVCLRAVAHAELF